MNQAPIPQLPQIPLHPQHQFINNPQAQSVSHSSTHSSFAYYEPGMPPPAVLYQQQRNLQSQVQKNVGRAKTPIQRFEEIPLCKLDVGVCDTLTDQFTQVCIKISYVLFPRSDQNSYRLRNWDLWGPFFFLLMFAFFVDNATQLLRIVFSMLIGACVVTFSVIALGGKVSFFQSVAIMNYCIFPIYICVFVLKLLYLIQITNLYIKIIVVTIGVLWAILSVRIFIGVNVPENRKFLATYPAILFYTFVGICIANS